MILVIGEALIDLIGEEGSGGNYTAVVGGANANVALALAVRGEEQRFLGRISEDGFGRQIASHLTSHGVDLSLAVNATEQTTLAVATIDANGVASYSFYTKDTADWGWTADELPTAETVRSLGTREIQYGCLGMAIEPGNLVVEAWLKSFFDSQELTLSHDLNIRPALGFDRESELIRVLRVNDQSHIIKASDADIEWLYGLEEGADLDEIASSWSIGKLVVVTKGPDGVSLYRDGERTDVAGQKVSLVDTVGAGDTFMANFLGELSALDALGDNPASRLSRLSNDELVAAASVANLAAGIVCERTGCQPPTRSEIEAKSRAD